MQGDRKFMSLEHRIPKGSPAPAWLQKVQFMRNAIAYLEAAEQRYGEIFNAPVITHHSAILLVSNPQALQRIFTPAGGVQIRLEDRF